MTKNQIKYLKMLGYTDSQEDGAILQNKMLAGMEGYVWKGQTFEEIMTAYPRNLEQGIRITIAGQIRNPR